MSEDKDPPIGSVKDMPELPHKLAWEEYDVMKSKVVDWLAQHPNVRQFIFDHVSKKGAIVHNKEYDTWKGANFADDKDDVDFLK